MKHESKFLTALNDRKTKSLYRKRRIFNANNADLLAFTSNDYLGLSRHPKVIEALQCGAEKYGVSSGAAHLVNGHTAAHHALEEELAEFTGYPRALLFSSGYQANLGIQQALLGRNDRVIHDKLNHASLLDGALMSRAKLFRYAHADPEMLQKIIEKSHSGETLVATDGVFSMDGDIAPLPEIATICEAHNAWLLVDDAHGFGVHGERGRGTVSKFELDSQSGSILMGTLGKALGAAGAFVAGSEALIETLIQQARTYIYTTASPPAVAEATRAALKIVGNEEGEQLRENLQARIAQFRQGAKQLGLPLMPSETAIQPILLGSTEKAMQFSQALEKQGILVTAIRPPTVPEGSARLRVTFSAKHTALEVEQLLEILEMTFHLAGK